MMRLTWAPLGEENRRMKDDSVESLGAALSRLGGIASGKGLDVRGRRGAPASARRFAEGLILCPDAPSAAALVQRDPEGAAAFLELGWYLHGRAQSGHISSEGPLPPDTTPFYSAAEIVIEFCEADDACS